MRGWTRAGVAAAAMAATVMATVAATRAFADSDDDDGGGANVGRGDSCAGLPNAAALAELLARAAAGTGIKTALGPGTDAGGLFGGARMWGAVVNRQGVLCTVATSTPDARQVWPGSQAIAKAKAYTANGFSLDGVALSTARLFTLSQPGHSLWGINQSNPFDPQLTGKDGRGKVTGGIITFGGGVPLYDTKGNVVGGVGVSGDTSCADHEVAKRVRDLLGLNPPGGPTVDDIVYTKVDGPSVFAHSLCIHTRRNGVFIGEESP